MLVAQTVRHQTISGIMLALAMGCTEPPDRSGPWLSVDDKMQSTLDRELEEARAEQDLMGLAMAIAFHEDHTLWVGTSGSAQLDPQVDWQPEQRSRMGSVTKTFTTSMIFQLVEEGVLTLDDPVEQWVPGRFSGMSIRPPLGHSSGIASYNYV
ncbi:MAG: serine hydrolase domain-containing protein, partial [Myxococcota bacterium]